jgi:hypothetical protein
MENLNESRSQIKRKYGEYSSIKVNETAPIRNEILRFVGKRFVTNEELENFLTKLSEERGKDVNGKQWFGRNSKYFESFNNRGQKVWTLSKYGSRVLEFIKKTQSGHNLNESIGLFKFNLITEAKLPYEIEKTIKMAKLNWKESSEVADDLYDEHGDRIEDPTGYVAFDKSRGIEYVFKTWSERSTYFIELTEDDNIVFAETYSASEKRYYDQDCENILGFSF